MVETKTEECVSDLRREYEGRGYSVSGSSETEVKVEIVPENVRVIVDAPMTVTKDSTKTFQEFTIEKPSQMYFLLMTATSIVDYEGTYGNSETTDYLKYFPDLDMRKMTLGDGSKVYTVKDVVTDEEFTFASRSVAWPGGYGTEA